MSTPLLVIVEQFLNTVGQARSPRTEKAYRTGMKAFIAMLDERLLGAPAPQPSPTPSGSTPTKNAPKRLPWSQTAVVTDLSDDAIAWFAQALKPYAPATEQLYLTAVMGFYEYLAAERLSDPNLPRLRLLIRQRARKPGQRLPQFPREDIEKVIEYAQGLIAAAYESPPQRLILLRDRAFIVTLADTGLRVHEACNLRRSDMDWNEGRALIIGKGDRQAVVRFSRRSLAAINDYLGARAEFDGLSGRPLSTLPLFARHDKAAGKKVKPITPTTGRNIIDQRVAEALGVAGSPITPHSFRHYFVTTTLRGSGGNLKLAQELARHKNIAVTQRYAHLSDDELDRGYSDIFDHPV